MERARENQDTFRENRETIVSVKNAIGPEQEEEDADFIFIGEFITEEDPPTAQQAQQHRPKAHSVACVASAGTCPILSRVVACTLVTPVTVDTCQSAASQGEQGSRIGQRTGICPS